MGMHCELAHAGIAPQESSGINLLLDAGTGLEPSGAVSRAGTTASYLIRASLIDFDVVRDRLHALDAARKRGSLR